VDEIQADSVRKAFGARLSGPRVVYVSRRSEAGADKKTFADVRRAIGHEQQYDVRGRRWMDCIDRVVTRPSDREIASQIRD